MTEEGQKQFDEFKLEIRSYLEQTSQLVDALKRGYEDLAIEQGRLLTEHVELSSKVDLIAGCQGILARKIKEFN